MISRSFEALHISNSTASEQGMRTSARGRCLSRQSRRGRRRAAEPDRGMVRHDRARWCLATPARALARVATRTEPWLLRALPRPSYNLLGR